MPKKLARAKYSVCISLPSRAKGRELISPPLPTRMFCRNHAKNVRQECSAGTTPRMFCQECSAGTTPRMFAKNVLPDLQSGSIKYQDLQSAKIVVHKCLPLGTRMFCRNRRSTAEGKVNCNPAALNIRICNPLKSLFTSAYPLAQECSAGTEGRRAKRKSIVIRQH